MGSSSFGSSFGALDDSADPRALSEYLDRVRVVPAVAAGKRESFRLLEVPRGGRVLDVGCGPGDDARELGDIVGSSGRVVGIDKSNFLITEARRRTPQNHDWVEFACADATALPFADATFDACRADRTIQHVPEADTALAELERVMRPGGLVVISEMFNVLDVGRRELGQLADEILGRFWSDDERRGWVGFLLPPLLRRAGFADIELHRRRERLTSFSDAELVLQLSRLCNAAVASGAVAAGVAHDWLDALAHEFVSGRAALHAEFVHLKARKPA